MDQCAEKAFQEIKVRAVGSIYVKWSSRIFYVTGIDYLGNQVAGYLFDDFTVRPVCVHRETGLRLPGLYGRHEEIAENQIDIIEDCFLSGRYLIPDILKEVF